MMGQVLQRRWSKVALVIVGVLGLLLLFVLTRGCSVEHLGQWAKQASAGQSPSPRSGQALVYDESGGRLIMFGGFYLAAPDGEAGYMGDTWAYDPAVGSWTELQRAGATPLGPVWSCHGARPRHRDRSHVRRVQRSHGDRCL